MDQQLSPFDANSKSFVCQDENGNFVESFNFEEKNYPNSTLPEWFLAVKEPETQPAQSEKLKYIFGSVLGTNFIRILRKFILNIK